MNQEIGKRAVEIARKAIEKWVTEKDIFKLKSFPIEFKKKCGVFTTIYTYPKKELRGCIGYPYPAQSLINGLISSAIEATKDPRFPPLRPEELKNVKIEVSILTSPELIKVKNPEDYKKKIKIGNDGLIIKYGFYSGLLLPQVPLEYKWNVETFLKHLCYKAGLPGNFWKNKEVKIYKFHAEVFEE